MNATKIKKTITTVPCLGMMYNRLDRGKLVRPLLKYLTEELGLNYKTIAVRSGMYNAKDPNSINRLNRLITNIDADTQRHKIKPYNYDFDACLKAYPYYTLLFLYQGDIKAAAYFAEKVENVKGDVVRIVEKG